MSYTEYFDLFYQAQEKPCKFRAFMIDVKNSKESFKNLREYMKYHKCVDYITDRLCGLNEKENKEIFLQNERNVPVYFLNKKNRPKNNLDSNPLILGDCACYFTREGTISEEQFLGILNDAIKKFNTTLSFHFMSGKYETESYAEGGRKLYKGYMLELLEDLSKKEGKLVSRDSIVNLKDEENGI